MKVVSFSATPLAGAPIRVAQCAALHDNVETRHVDLERWGIFPHDHVHSEDPEYTRQLVEEADVLHFYNTVHLDTTLFSGINFRDWLDKKAMVWHFQSTTMLVARLAGISLADIHESPVPKIVIAQYPERFLPEARVVRNPVFLHAAEYQPRSDCNIDVSFAPTKTCSAWHDRWNTKGMPETVASLVRLSKSTGAACKVIHNCTLEETLKIKRQSRIVLDDLVTGSYHLSALEGLAMGKLVCTYLDQRTDYVMRQVSGSNRIPFVNVRVEDIFRVLEYLMTDPVAVRQIGEENRSWMEEHWSEYKIADEFQTLYRMLLENPGSVKRQSAFSLSSSREYFIAHSGGNRIFESRFDNQTRGFFWTLLDKFPFLVPEKKLRAKRIINDVLMRLNLRRNLKALGTTKDLRL